MFQGEHIEHLPQNCRPTTVLLFPLLINSNPWSDDSTDLWAPDGGADDNDHDGDDEFCVGFDVMMMMIYLLSITGARTLCASATYTSISVNVEVK